MEDNKTTAAHCEKCRSFLPLQAPFHYEKSGYPDGVTVYGFCTKDVTRNSYFYPVYIPDGGTCKSFKGMVRQNKQAVTSVDGQMYLEV